MAYIQQKVSPAGCPWFAWSYQNSTSVISTLPIHCLKEHFYRIHHEVVHVYANHMHRARLDVPGNSWFAASNVFINTFQWTTVCSYWLVRFDISRHQGHQIRFSQNVFAQWCSKESTCQSSTVTAARGMPGGSDSGKQRVPSHQSPILRKCTSCEQPCNASWSRRDAGWAARCRCGPGLRQVEPNLEMLEMLLLEHTPSFRSGVKLKFSFDLIELHEKIF